MGELRKRGGGGGGDGASRNSDLAPLEKQLAELRAEIYRKLTPMQRVQVARHPKRPYPLDYIRLVFTDFVALHGDRLFAADPAILGAWARLAPPTRTSTTTHTAPHPH